MKIIITQDGMCADHAALELKRLVKRVSLGKIDAEIERKAAPATIEQGTITLALLSELSLPTSGDPFFDDIIDINITNLTGYIAGSNVRSILIGVYKFMHSSGCRFVRPGVDGEYLPPADLMNHKCVLRDIPSYRFRGECIEGGVSVENVIETINWAPKIGYNSFMLEFMIPHFFFQRWYSHTGSTIKKSEPLSVEMAAYYTAVCEQEIKKCGLMLHSAGHGWTCEPFGVEGLGWDPDMEMNLPESVTRHFAMLNGKRELYKGVPLNTNLCYSNPETRRTVVEYCVEYMNKKPFIDVLHIWLADGTNNHCECDDCVKMNPVEYYIMLMNEIDEEFERRNISAKLVFIIYVDLLWAPKIVELNKSDRFILLFAPFTRSYTEPYTTEEFKGELTPYERNNLKFPRTMIENLAHLKEWQKRFDGPGFVYEYHQWTYHYSDPGYYGMCELLLEDIKRLGDLKLHGIVEDKTQRSYFPTGFPSYVAAHGLYNKEYTLDELAEDYFPGAFGEEGMKVRDYLSGLSKLFDIAEMRENRFKTPEGIERLKKIPKYVMSHSALIARNLKLCNPCHAKSWEYISYHTTVAVMYAQALVMSAEGDKEGALNHFNALIDYLSNIEDEIQPVLDLFLFERTLRGKFGS